MRFSDFTKIFEEEARKLGATDFSHGDVVESFNDYQAGVDLLGTEGELDFYVGDDGTLTWRFRPIDLS